MTVEAASGSSGTGTTVRRHCFTLAEILAAMAVLVVLMLVVFRFFASAQRVWSLTGATTEVYEKARIALDVITRDLQSATARSNDVPGSHIYFEQFSADEIRFVTASSGASYGGTSRLCEIGYKLDTSDHEFKRAWENDSAGANWDLYGSRPNESFVNAQTGYRKVVGGVLDLQFDFYADNVASVGTWAGASYATKLPSAANVTLKVLDTQSMKKWELLDAAGRARLESEVARTFSKMIFLGGRG